MSKSATDAGLIDRPAGTNGTANGAANGAAAGAGGLGGVRSALEMQREADAMMADAVQVRQTAAERAERILARAEVAAQDVETEARRASEQALGDAQERADRIVADAMARAEELDTEARRTESAAAGRAADIVARAHADAAQLTDDLDALISRLRRTLDDAKGDVEHAERTLAGLREAPEETGPASRTASVPSDADAPNVADGGTGVAEAEAPKRFFRARR